MNIEDLNLYALKYFFDAVESQSLTAAARKNFVTRSAVSQAIIRLEGWAECQLLTHKKNTFQLTNQGENFYRSMKASYSTFAASVTNQVQGPEQLKIGCSFSLIEPFLFPIFRKNKPIKNLHLLTGTTARLVSDLNQGILNIVFYVGDPPLDGENFKILHKGSFVLASTHRQKTEQIITTEARPEVSRLKAHFLKKKKAPSFLTVESWTVAAKLASEIDCACLVPDFLLNDELRKIDLRGFASSYNIIVQHVSRERLTAVEVKVLNALTHMF